MHFLYKNLKIENFEDYPKSQLNVTERKEIKEEDDENLLEDNLDLPGTIEKAKIHGNSKKILYVKKKKYRNKNGSFL